MPFYKTEAINLKVIKFSESDKILSLFTKEKGKISAIAKSAYKPSSKYGGRLEIFSYNTYLLATGKNIDIINQVETIESFPSIRTNEKKLLSALYMLKVVYYFLEEKVPNPVLFDLLLKSLRILEKKEQLYEVSSVIRSFNINFTEIEGILSFESFPENIKNKVICLKNFDDSKSLTKQEIEYIDSVILQKIGEQIGKDIFSWRLF